MLENIKEFWYLYVILAALIVALPFAFKAAFGAASRHSKEFNENLEKLRKNKELRDAYGVLTAPIIANAPADTLFEGAAVCLEYRCQKTESTQEFYTSLNDGQRKIYALYYLLNDAKSDRLSAFFKQSTRPLTSDAADAVKEIYAAEIADTVCRMFDCYDEDNETASVIPEEIEKLDEKYAILTKNTDMYAAAGEYIKENSDFFVQTIDKPEQQ